MPIYPNQIALSVDVADRLKSADEAPLSYLNGTRFTDSSELGYFTSENAIDIFTKRCYSNPTNEDVASYVFGSLAANQSNFQFVDLSKDTPKHFVDLIDSRAVQASYPIASFDDLSTIVVNAFLPLTNIRKSSFIILEKEGSKVVARTYFGNALLTDNAITENNGNKLEVNFNEDSRIVIDSSQKFLDNISEEIEQRISNLRPIVDSSNKFSGCLSANLVPAVIDAVLEGVNYIRENLSCTFAEFDPNLSVRVVYHEKNDGTGETISSDMLIPYSDYVVSGYADLFAAPTDGSEYRAWATSKNSNTPAYYPGSVLQVLESSIELFPIFTPIYRITYKYLSSDSGNETVFSNQATINAGNVYDTALNDSVYSVKPLLANHDSNEKFIFASGKQTTYMALFKGYATAASGSVKYAFNGSKFSPASFVVNGNTTLWAKFGDRNLIIGTNRLTNWRSKKFQKGSITTYPSSYPLTIAASDYSELSLVNAFTKIGFVFTGWVNELNRHHVTKVYLEKVEDGNGRTVLGENFLYEYKQNPYNAWSVRLSPSEPYERWPRTQIFWANLPSPRNSTFRFFFKIVDFTSKKLDAMAGSNGQVGVSEIHFK